MGAAGRVVAVSILGTGLWLGEGGEQRLADSLAGRPAAAVEPVEAALAVTEVLLSTARAAAGMKQQELADLIGVTQPTLSLWERGRATIPADRVAALTYRLGLPKGSIAARQPLAARKLARAHAARCGTYSGAIRHVQRGEKACAQCAKARREYHASRYVPSPRVPAECGTDTAYKAHRARGEEACVACRVAHAAYERARKAAA